MLVVPILLSALTTCSSNLYATAQNSKECIELRGFKWSKNYIGVYVARGVSETQRQETLFAMQVWFSAQVWFADSYMGSFGTPFLLYLEDQPGIGVVTVSFFYGEGVEFAGRTAGTYPDFRIEVNLPPERAVNPHDPLVEEVLVHEFGHVLGLGHAENKQDLMYEHLSETLLPSTLDLYALYELSVFDVQTLGSSLCLPSDIGYGIPPWSQEVPYYFMERWRSPEWNISSPQQANPGETVILHVQVRNTGGYPWKWVSSLAETDFGRSYLPEEPFPTIVEPGRQSETTFAVLIPNDIRLGLHTINFTFVVAPIGVEGWLKDTISFKGSRVLAVVGSSTGTATEEGSTNAGVFDNVSLGETIIPITLLLLVGVLATSVVVLRKRAATEPDRRKESHQAKFESGATGFCRKCGARTTRDSKFCTECGTRLEVRES